MFDIISNSHPGCKCAAFYVHDLPVFHTHASLISPLHFTELKKNTIHQVTTMLSTSKYVLFPVHNHLLTTGASADDPSL